MFYGKGYENMNASFTWNTSGFKTSSQTAYGLVYTSQYIPDTLVWHMIDLYILVTSSYKPSDIKLIKIEDVESLWDFGMGKK